MSDSDSGKPKDIWPAIERRKISDRRVERPVRRARVLKEDLEVRTPGPIRREERRSGRDRRDDGAWKAVPLELTLAPEPPEASDEETLISAAIDARSRAQARYSGFKVGAALETSDGSIVTGCNVENATYALTVCAERVALLKALSEGSTMFTRIVVVADTNDPTPPCGPCRQLLWEYCGDIEVVLANLERATARLKLSALLPMPFDGRLLE